MTLHWTELRHFDYCFIKCRIVEQSGKIKRKKRNLRKTVKSDWFFQFPLLKLLFSVVKWLKEQRWTDENPIVLRWQSHMLKANELINASMVCMSCTRSHSCFCSGFVKSDRMLCIQIIIDCRNENDDVKVNNSHRQIKTLQQQFENRSFDNCLMPPQAAAKGERRVSLCLWAERCSYDGCDRLLPLSHLLHTNRLVECLA